MNSVLRFFDNRNYDSFYLQGNTNSLRATLFFAVYYIYVLLNINKLSGEKRMYAKLYLIGTCCGILAYRLQMITRIEIYFDFFSVVALPAIYECNASYKDGSESTLLYLLNRYILPAMIGQAMILKDVDALELFRRIYDKGKMIVRKNGGDNV